jgi:SWI/SNF-related matrix-associated actin-dependent regulator of chromatin subfamily A-like protein 1
MGHHKKFGGVTGYKVRYCDGGKSSSNLQELNYLLNETCFFRREKKDVAKDLPEKQRQTILCDITTRDTYTEARDNFVQFLENSGYTDEEIETKLRGEIMVKMGELKRISALGKLNEVKEFVNEVIDSGEKLVLFCSLHAIVDALKKEFPDAVTITGRDNGKQKQESIDKFQNDKTCQLVICNIKAAGVGITLTASSRVAFVEYPWTYADCVQCEDRVHRIGQKNTVMATYFLGQDTIDEDLYKLIVSKAETANAITGATDKMETSYVNKMLNLLNYKK